MRFLIIGDPHFKPTTTIETAKLHQQTLRAIENHKPDSVVVLGDVLDRHATIHMHALNNALSYIKDITNAINSKKARYKCYVLVGNHDIANNATYLPEVNSLVSFREIEGVKLVTKPYMERIDNIDYVFAPYVPNGRLAEALLDNLDLSNLQSSVLFCHQEFKGCMLADNVASNSGDDPKSETLQKFNRIISGHIHHYSESQIDNLTLTYLGAPYQISFSESEDKALGLLETLNLTRIRIELIVKRTIYCDVDEAQDVIDNCMTMNDIRHGKFRIIVRGDRADIDKARVKVNGKMQSLRDCRIKTKYKKCKREIIVIPNTTPPNFKSTKSTDVMNINFINKLKSKLESNDELTDLLNSYLD